MNHDITRYKGLVVRVKTQIRNSASNAHNLDSTRKTAKATERYVKCAVYYRSGDCIKRKEPARYVNCVTSNLEYIID